jgi:hypothetical protein
MPKVEEAAPYQSLTGTYGGRRGTIYYQYGLFSVREAQRILEDGLSDSGENIDILRSRLRKADTAVFRVHRTLAYPDVVQAFLRAEKYIFACSVMSVKQLETDLEHEPFVVESLDVQIVPALKMDVNALRMALLSWCERICPGQIYKVMFEMRLSSSQ